MRQFPKRALVALGGSVFAAGLLAGSVSAQPVLPESGTAVTFAPLRVPGFSALQPADRALAYELSLAALAGQRLPCEGRSPHGAQLRALMEETLTHLPKDAPADERQAFLAYLRRFYVHHGYHDTGTGLKFVPSYTPEQLEHLLLLARAAGAHLPGVTTAAGIPALVKSLGAPLFDPEFDRLAAQPPVPAKPEGRLARKGRAEELVWHTGAVDVPAGRYQAELRAMAAHVQAARALSERPALDPLLTYLRTGDQRAATQARVAALGAPSPVELVLGFFPSDRDPRGQKGEFAAWVLLDDPAGGALVRRIAGGAAAYLDRTPALGPVRRALPPPPVASAAQVLVAAGRAGPLLQTGLTLPLFAEGAELPGGRRRSYVFTNVLAQEEALLSPVLSRTFSCAPIEGDLARRYHAEAAAGFAALREVLGQGLRPTGLSPEPVAPEARAARTVLQEARADLVALWAIGDSLSVGLRVVAGPQVVAEAYRGYLRDALFSLRHRSFGGQVAAPREAARILVAHYLIQRAGAAQKLDTPGRRAYCLTDARRLRLAAGVLLGELVRIELEEDHAAAAQLLADYLPAASGLPDEVLVRAQAAGLARHLALINPGFVLHRTGAGQLVDVELVPETDFLRQQLGYSRSF